MFDPYHRINVKVQVSFPGHKTIKSLPIQNNQTMKTIQNEFDWHQIGQERVRR